MADATNGPKSVPLPVSSDDDSVASVLNKSHPVQGDLRIDPDPSLQGYQEELDSGGNNDIIENEEGTSPPDLTVMPVKRD